MTDMKTQGGFTGDPTPALAVTASGGCCGNAPEDVKPLRSRPADTAASPCCGTATEAQAASGCCGPQAKAQAVASGASCCG